MQIRGLKAALHNAGVCSCSLHYSLQDLIANLILLTCQGMLLRLSPYLARFLPPHLLQFSSPRKFLTGRAAAMNATPTSSIAPRGDAEKGGR